jgi:hypothetical protein
MSAGPQRNVRVPIMDANARERTVAGSEGVVKVALLAGGGECVLQGALCELVRIVRKKTKPITDCGCAVGRAQVGQKP